ncbi:TATA box-binding protein-like 1 [Venturia canescens]|uniref:TATA box-binding protein-like 1 n=1 Tax=Venturia canescens TaxID=32260 RepID=UPI001C9C2593|nr:TATA box-binding protein-like 1 [Venturia canescens]XP_043274945.1 TATA box-binding protein-like 1 [Venturia canescens]
MATVIQKNGMKPLTNGTLNHVENVDSLDNAAICAESEKGEKLYKCSTETEEAETEAPPEIDILIRNVVCNFSVRCHLNLREIALTGSNVEYRRENGMITMKFRRPYTTATIWSSGKVTVTGAETEAESYVAARRTARALQKLGFNVRFRNFRVVNVMGTCLMPWAIKITPFSMRYRENADYEPELHPGVTYKIPELGASLKIFSTGSVTITAPSVANVGAAIEQIFPLVYEFRKKRTPEEELAIIARRRKAAKRSRQEFLNDPDPMIMEDPLMSEAEEEEEEEMLVESDASWD